MDRGIIRYFLGLGGLGGTASQWYFCEKCAEAKDRVQELVKNVPKDLSKREIRESEVYVLDAHDSFVVYRKPDEDMLRLGFEYVYYTSVIGGDIYNYKKQVAK
jgi:uncharacterized Fe-S cluster-containing protein